MIARKYKVEIYYWENGKSPILVQVGGELENILSKLGDVVEANPTNLNILMFLRIVDKGDEPTEKQLRYARKLMEKHGLSYDLSDMSSFEVSMLIQRLKERSD